MNLHRAQIRIFSLLFGDFNGVQVFLYPMTLFYWIDTDSFLLASSGLFTSQKYYFPLVVFILVFIYTAFLVIKNYSALHSDEHTHPQAERTSFYLTVIDLHKALLLIMVTAALIYLVSAFLRHYYGIEVPLQTLYLALGRIVCVLLILVYALRNSWTRPYREQGMELRRAGVMVQRDYHAHQGRYLLHGSVYALLAILVSALYNLLVLNVFYSLFSLIGISPNLYFAATSGFPALFYDIFVLCVSLMLSNLLFAPLVKLAVHLAEKFHPHRFLLMQKAAHGETGQ